MTEINKVFTLAISNPTAKLMLIYLIENSSENGTTVTHSQLAKYCGVGRSTIINWLNCLEADGLITSVKNHTQDERPTAKTYFVHLDKIEALNA